MSLIFKVLHTNNMKKIIAFFILIQSSLLFSQTILTTFPLELKKSKEFKQIVQAENTTTHEIFVFASDKENLTILKYNTALFLSNQLTLARPDSSYKLLSGYSFDSKGNPTLYWSSSDLNKILAVQYDLESKTIAAILNYEIPFVKESIVTLFQENNVFYILTQKETEQKLILYVFKNGKKEVKILDFSSFKFLTKKEEAVTLNDILEVYPIEKIDTNQFNPLFKGAQKTKIFVEKNRLILSLDYNFKQTELFDIDLNTFEIQEKKIPQPITKKQTGWSNSFYHENKIYQLNINEEEMLFDIKDYQTSEVIKSYVVSKNDTISFKNSPLLIQNGGQKPRDLKNTIKFLQRLLFLDIGLTVYQTPKDVLITIGGTSDGQTGYSNITEGLNVTMSQNFNAIAFDLFNNQGPTTIYFESVFDKNLNPEKIEQEPLAVDFISQFNQQHREVTLSNIIKYNNYYILGYYDIYNKQFTMRKFIDGFESSF